jgi:hypothetical protein
LCVTHLRSTHDVLKREFGYKAPGPLHRNASLFCRICGLCVQFHCPRQFRAPGPAVTNALVARVSAPLPPNYQKAHCRLCVPHCPNRNHACHRSPRPSFAGVVRRHRHQWRCHRLDCVCWHHTRHCSLLGRCMAPLYLPWRPNMLVHTKQEAHPRAYSSHVGDEPGELQREIWNPASSKAICNLPNRHCRLQRIQGFEEAPATRQPAKRLQQRQRGTYAAAAIRLKQCANPDAHYIRLI